MTFPNHRLKTLIPVTLVIYPG